MWWQRQWLDILEDTKKKKAVKDKQKKEAANRLSDQFSPSPLNSPIGGSGLPSRKYSIFFVVSHSYLSSSDCGDFLCLSCVFLLLLLSFCVV